MRSIARFLAASSPFHPGQAIETDENWLVVDITRCMAWIGEPSSGGGGSGNEDCTSLYSAGLNLWNDMACSATMSAVCKLPISSLCSAITAGYTCYEGDSMSHIPTTEPSALPPSESMRWAPSLRPSMVPSESISPSHNPSDVPSCTPSTLDPTSTPVMILCFGSPLLNFSRHEAAANNLQGHVVSIHSAEEN
eukprot:scaffold74636_cov67-Attheya_sp.AAC.2